MAQGPSTMSNITSDKSGSQVVFSSPGTHPLPKGAGQSVTSAAKVAGQPNGSVLGQVSGTSVIVNNPA